jgi:hypothetical protein
MESLKPGFESVKSGAADSEIAELRESVNKLQREMRQPTIRVNLMDRRDSAQPSPVNVGAAIVAAQRKLRTKAAQWLSARNQF